ncbi:hypothetical protein BTE48_11595 [Oceanospirillum multiglobuliferum]|uniref:Zinc finger/thioredoxin putative domain-containing protein n=2 Tax=Oceanospirillum multiglobuliferum TaxID=64969 RepID=A0A1V4T344_9GAMM|nr:hypothetical protein BTE48_11595 [Oceanospirillum multiglobuliferum]
MDERLTRCPHCKTCFVITEAILQQALGVARCGNCLKIYNASHHMFELEQGDSVEGSHHFTPAVEAPVSPIKKTTEAQPIQPEMAPQKAEKPEATPVFSEPEEFSVLPEMESFELDDDELATIRQARKQSTIQASDAPVDQALQTLIADSDFHQGHIADNRRFPKETDRIPLTEQLSLWLKGKLILPLALALSVISVIFIILWANSRILAQYPALSGLVESICSVATCDHLLMSDFAQLEAKQMSLVASEGEHLYAEFVLENLGEQIRFPAIAITLQSASGEVLSEQTFQPDQYLQNKPFADHQLPSELPISLSFPFPPSTQEVKHFAVLFLPPLN